MKEQLSGVELVYLIRELQHLRGAKIDKVFGQDKPDDTFLFQLHKSGVGKSYLYVGLPGVVCEASFKPPFPDHPPHFVMGLRRKITNARIQSIEQMGFDRIIRIILLTKYGETYLYIELVNPGNIVLTDSNGRILATRYHKTWSKERDIRPGKTYALPKQQQNPRNLSLEQFSTLYQTSDLSSPVKFLAMECSLGGEFAEAVLDNANVSKDVELDTHNRAAVYNSLQALFTQDIRVVKLDSAVYPFAFKELTSNSDETFNEAIAQLILHKEKKREEKAFSKHINKTKNKFERIIEAQTKQRHSLQKKADQDQAMAEAVYAHYQPLSTLLYQASVDAKRLSAKEFEKKYLSLSYVKKVSVKDRTLVVEVDDAHTS